MVIYGVSFDMVGKQPIVLLKTVENNKFLPIWIGHPEAAAILMKLQGASTPRPMTHDLLSDVLGELDVECTRVAVTELRENTFYASITLRQNGRELEIDSRPSDALALAVGAGAPIFAAEEVIAESATRFEPEAGLGAHRQETVMDLRRAVTGLAARQGTAYPAALATALGEKAKLAATGGRWSPVGTGPLIADDPTYPNTSGEGFSKLAGRV